MGEENRMAEIVKGAVMDAWEIMVYGVAVDADAKGDKKRKMLLSYKENEWKIEGVTKLKALLASTQMHENPEDAVMHFIKYAEYYLPRSMFENTLRVILEKIPGLRKKYEGAPQDLLTHIKYMLGYLAWDVEAYCNVLTYAGNDPNKVKEELRKMFAAEFSVLGDEKNKLEEYVSKLFSLWKSADKTGGRKGDEESEEE
jgi:hypothetical protein